MRGPHDEEIDKNNGSRDQGSGDHARERLTEFVRKRMPPSDADANDTLSKPAPDKSDPTVRKP